ncbi:hypothetical protein BDL97_09G069400 [Sphagnum fallax]|nr:hypothetical protein BDL97_09G069400 [Sphagnum fallax]
MGEELETEKQDWSNGGSYSGQLPSPRSLHTATCVGEKIVVFGGQEDNSAKNDVFIFDTVAKRWTMPKVLGTPPSPRFAHSAVLLEGGRILIYGGWATTAKGDIWFLEVNTPFVRIQSKLLNMDVVAWSKGVTGNAPQPVVICGPSGVGKGTLIGKLMKDFPDKFGFSVSHTTRSPREKEQDGVHYHFTTRHIMEKEIRERKFLESADVHGNLYGTSWAAVDAVTNSGKTCILDIDVQGAQSVKKSSLDAVFVFIKPPYPEEEQLEKRLRGRGTESEEQIQKRLRNAKAELERAKDATLFDHILVNAKLDEAYESLKEMLGVNNLPINAKANGICEHYDAAANEFVQEARSGHSASLIGSKVLICGGITASASSIALGDVAILDLSNISGGAPGTTRGLNWVLTNSKSNGIGNYCTQHPSGSLSQNHKLVSPSSSERLVAGDLSSTRAANGFTR